MTYKEIYEKLAETNLPVVYHHWEKGQVPDLPYIVFTYPNNNDFMADDSNYVEIVELNVELYAKNKDITLEHTVEGVLSNYFQYAKSSVWIEEEQMYETIYETEVIIRNAE